MNNTASSIFFLTALLALAGLFGCADKTSRSGTEPAITYVDAKVRIYHDDGSRTYAEYQPFETRTVAHLPNLEPASAPQLSKYGGLLTAREQATGFFHVKKIGDRWWGVDPLGYRYVNIALNSLNAKGSEGTKQALTDKFGSKENWINTTIDLLQDHGFNCAGSWSDTEAIVAANKTREKPMAYCINWNFMSKYGRKRGGTFQQPGHTGYPQNAIFAFDPAFAEFCDERARQIAKYKDDPNLFGHFSDNEMPFNITAITDYLSLPEGDHGRAAAEEWLKEKGITEARITDEHREEFMALVGEKYFSVVSAAIKKYDPNHMYIGARFYDNEKHHEQFMRVVGKYVDIVSNNYYNHWTPDEQHLAQWAEWTGRPFIVTEYYTKGEDSGMGNTSGAGWIVRTQNDRGLFYQNYNLALLNAKSCVGWHYFKYQDNDPDAKGVDPSNVDANKGIVSNRYVPWTPLLDRMKELNRRAYAVIDHFDRAR